MNIKASKKRKSIYVTGAKDQRGPDNTITVWLDEQGRLCIQVDKPTVRCYPFSHVEENASWVRVIQNK
jgi:hypothetical protein